MFKTRTLVQDAAFIAAAGILAMLVPGGAVGAEPVGSAAEQEAKHLAVLASDASAADKALACKGLAIYGSRDAVPSLAPLLADEQLASWARIALQAIPDSAADAALRQALDDLQGRLVIGVIHSIAVRRDAQAVEQLVRRLKDADVQVAEAATVALGRVGGPTAAKALEASLADARAVVRSAAAEGCILYAEGLQADGQIDQAAKWFDAVRQADVPKQRIVEATRGAILARGIAGTPLLLEQLRSPDRDLLAIGLRTARELSGQEVTRALAAELPELAIERQTLLLLVLADRGDTAALPAVLAAARSDSEALRSASMIALGQLGDVSCLPMLLEAAMDKDDKLSQTASKVLATIPGKEVDQAVFARLAAAEGDQRLELIHLAGLRSIAAAVPLLLKAADDPESRIRAAALMALGRTVSASDLPVLIARLTADGDDDEAAIVVRAVGAACQRMPDREACAALLVGALASSSDAGKSRVLEVLAALGGTKALETVAASAKEGSPEIRETASRLLGEWMTMDAAPVLLELARSGTESRYKIRALRGYIRLIRQFPLEADQRTEMSRIAMETAERDDERRLVLEVLERYPSLETLRMATEAAKSPSLKEYATAVSLTIAQRASADPEEIRKLLAHVDYTPTKIEIVQAVYGAGNQTRDVTEILRRRVGDFPLIVLSSTSYNSALGGDPAPGISKQLRIQYRINGRPGEVVLPENATILLPTPK